MNCTCGGKTKVLSTRTAEEGVFRQRECTVCGRAFYTEEYETDDLEGIHYCNMILQQNRRNKLKEVLL